VFVQILTNNAIF